MKTIITFLLLSSITQATPFHLTSHSKQPILLELYTSEGCSSCPPAEKWLAKFKTNKKLWKEVIPMAFHVDYWDYLGWKDRFALTQNAQRQRQFVQQDLANATYTPEVLQNGKEWSRWQSFFSFLQKPKINETILDLKIAKTVTIHYSVPQKNLVVHVAILGFDLQQKIAKGENKNQTLMHQFVVLSHQKSITNQAKADFTLPIKVSTPAKRYGIVAWVEKKNKQQPLQAVGGWLPADIAKEILQ